MDLLVDCHIAYAIRLHLIAMTRTIKWTGVYLHSIGVPMGHSINLKYIIVNPSLLLLDLNTVCDRLPYIFSYIKSDRDGSDVHP